jgi:hypothetical protein
MVNKDVMLNYTYQQEDTDSRISTISREATQLSLLQGGDRITLPFQEWRASKLTDYELLFDIYMEDFMRQICLNCTDRNMWYKLYADDFVLITSYQYLNSLLISLYLKYQKISISKRIQRNQVCLLSRDTVS